MSDHPPERPDGPIDDETAARMLRWRRRAAERVATARRRADADKADTDAWLGDTTAGDLREIANLDRVLTDWLADEIERDPDGPKSRSFPAGIVKSTAGGLSIEVDDEAALLAWATENCPDIVVTRPPTVPKAGAKSLAAMKPEEPGDHPVVTEAGEIVPGVRLVRSERSFRVEESPVA